VAVLNLTIEMLADSEAALIERVTALEKDLARITSERDTYKAMTRELLKLTHLAISDRAAWERWVRNSRKVQQQAAREVIAAMFADAHVRSNDGTEAA
jgi:hypothetical protein